MSLSPGTKLGPYQIIAPLGAGGMGEVYKAQDTRLERTVAIKILPSHLSDDAELRERFEREARAVSSLNHPHICTLHDIGREGDVAFLVMEHIEGETLAERLKKGPLPLTEGLRYAGEIADALDKAHRQGVVHRDLKPGNIMLTRSGAKLLDFGLAKVAGSASTPDVATLSSLPTEQKSLTAAGAILGTFQYMAPEQLEGGDIDARTDIFALGAVIYEMVTGKKAFEGKSQASLIGAIMTGEPPPMSEVQPLSPAGLEHVIKTCLSKDPDKRWQSAGDVARELEWIAGTGSQAGVAVSVARAPRREPLAWGVAGLMAGVVATALAASIFFGSPTVSKHVARFAIQLAASETWVPGGLALSPEGSRLAYIATSENGQRLYLRRIDQLEATPLQGTDGATSPFFAPDGRWVGFAADNKLQKVSVDGGLPLTLCDSPPLRGASWGEDDVIVFGTTNTMEEGLFQVPAGGGTAQVLTRLNSDEGEFSHRWPQVLPGGKAVLFTIRKGRGDSVAVLSRQTGEIHTLIENGLQGRYVSTGHLVYAQAGQLLAVPFDIGRLQVSGDPVPLVEDVPNEEFSVSGDGTLVYPSGLPAGDPETELLWVDRHGAARPLTDKPGRYSESRLSPDGRRLVFSILRQGFDYDIWVLELARGTVTRLTFGEGNESVPIWTPDGTRVTFSSGRSGRWNSFSVPADGSGEAVQLTESQFITTAASWSPDGKVLAVQQLRPGTGMDIGVLRPEEGGEPDIFIGTPFNEGQPIFSPDGRWLAYTSDESGQEEVYVRAFPGPGGKWQISTEGGGNPLWARNGRELFYRNGEKVMVAGVSTDAEFSPSAPALLFEQPFVLRAFHVQELLNYDVTPDGREFVMIRPVEGDEGESVPPTELHVVLNWFEELKARVPTE